MEMGQFLKLNVHSLTKNSEAVQKNHLLLYMEMWTQNKTHDETQKLQVEKSSTDKLKKEKQV